MSHDHKKLQALYHEKLNVECTLEFVNPQLLNNDHLHYQRDRMESKVQHAVKHFNPDKPSIAFAAKREDNSLWLLDGQHHTEAAVRLGISQVPVLVFHSDGYEDEAKVFEGFQELQLDGE